MTRDNAQTASASEGDVARYLWASAPRRRELYAILERARWLRHSRTSSIVLFTGALIVLLAGGAWLIQIIASLAFGRNPLNGWILVAAANVLFAWFVLKYTIRTALYEIALRRAAGRLPRWYCLRWKAFGLSRSQRDHLVQLLAVNDRIAAWYLIQRIKPCWPDAPALRWICSNRWGTWPVRAYFAFIVLWPLVTGALVLAVDAATAAVFTIVGLLIVLTGAVIAVPMAFIARHQFDETETAYFGNALPTWSVCPNCQYLLRGLQPVTVNEVEVIRCPECGFRHRV